MNVSFNLQPVLKNELVTLRPLQQTDFQSLYQVAKDPLIWEQHPINNRYEFSIFKPFFEESIQSKGCLIIMDNKDGKVIGASRYKIISQNPGALEIGWSFLDRAYWGGLYNKAFKELMISHAFNM